MPDVFTRTEVLCGGAMHAQNGIVVPFGGLTGVLMQNIVLDYQQQVTRVYELGTRGHMTRVYYVSGRSQGVMRVQHIIGPGVTMQAFYDNFGDVCNACHNNVVIDLSPNICAAGAGAALAAVGGPLAAVDRTRVGGRARYLCKFCVLTRIGMSVAAQDFVVNENSELMFSSLEFES